ncbi:MAG: hypothetical protein JSS66_10300 [Armatimonadetes bacterium]|nr:hypothetical protein [Armatimonadota bacterium]
MKTSLSLLACLFFAVVGSGARASELIDFASLNDVSGSSNLRGSGAEVSDYPLPVVDNARTGMFDHSVSLMFDRVVHEALNSGKPRYEDASLTFDLTDRVDRSFNFPDPSKRISLWIHVDGPSSLGAGNVPLIGPRARPSAFVLELLTADGQTIASYPHSCSRGWNELKFVLSSQVPTHHVSTPGIPNNRIQPFAPEGAAGTVTGIRLRILGTDTCPESEYIGKIALNTCTIEDVPTKIPVVMFYDDAFSSFVTYAQQPLLDNGANATLGFVGAYYAGLTPGRMTKLQTDQAFALGFDLVNQTMTNRPLHNVSSPRPYVGTTFQPGVYDELSNALNLMRANGLVRPELKTDQFLIYPGGASDSQVYAAMNELGIRYGRNAVSDTDPSGGFDLVGHPWAGAALDMTNLQKSVAAFGRLEAFEQFQDWFEEGLAEGRPRFIVWHEIMSDHGQIESLRLPTKYNTPEFHAAVLAYLFDLKQQGRIEFKTLPQWFNDLDTLHKIRGNKY